MTEFCQCQCVKQLLITIRTTKMHYLSNICALCLVSTQNLQDILSVDHDGIIIEQKLKLFLVELVTFKPDIHKYVCQICLENANSIYKFKLMCLKNIAALTDYLDKLEERGPYQNIKCEKDLDEDIGNQTEISENDMNYIIPQVNIIETSVNEESTKSTIQRNYNLTNETNVSPTTAPVEIFIKTEVEEKLETDESYSSTKDSAEKSPGNDIKKEEQGACNNFQTPYDAFKELNEVKCIDEEDETSTNNTASVDSPGENDDETTAQKRRYECTECHKSFKYRSYLKKHIRIHTNERPYECSICYKTFKQSQHLITHKRTHTGEKPYSCEICHKTFNNGGNITNHMRIHTGEKPYHCQLCQYKCIKAGDLKRHMMGHTGERPYVCTICERRFTQTAHLKDHMQTHRGSDRP